MYKYEPVVISYPFKHCSALLVTSHCALRRKYKIVSAHWHAGSAPAERVGQKEIDGVTRRVLCTWWLLGLAVEGPWLGLGGPILTLTA